MQVPAVRVSLFVVLAGGLSAACAPAAGVGGHPLSGGGAAVSIGTLTSGLTAVRPSGVCAAMPGIFLPPNSVAPNMVITSLAGEHAPVLLGHRTPRTSTQAVGFEWTEVQSAAVRGIPTDFGPRNTSSLVSALPNRVDQLVETANTFRTVSDAVRWFATWPGVSALSPQLLEPGPVRDAIPGVAPLTQADEAEVTDWAPAGFDMPSDTQYVMRTGKTVVSLELIGGEDVTEASTVSFARAALEMVVRRCEPN